MLLRVYILVLLLLYYCGVWCCCCVGSFEVCGVLPLGRRALVVYIYIYIKGPCDWGPACASVHVAVFSLFIIRLLPYEYIYYYTIYSSRSCACVVVVTSHHHIHTHHHTQNMKEITATVSWRTHILHTTDKNNNNNHHHDNNNNHNNNRVRQCGTSHKQHLYE